ncbi:TIGR04255 family protein [Ensifer sp. ENS06]|uniref:TIGR04255 family protein n=1 Tax=Ensifer sp. ENS06 TaxID=2769276 RepID=UPI00177B515E|nr:TIGR04255 family protein [Ensifer sp. ENS06]MBD9621848.1 TIGR04255 family protein [Ensifer sp. ENS06]
MHYKKAPIVEALLQLQFAEGLTDADMGRVSRKAESHYTEKEDMRDFQVAVRVHNGNATPEIGAVNPWHRHTSKDGADFFVVNRNQFTVGRRAPYENWEKFFGRFERDYDFFYKTVGFKKITRIGLRYINRIDVPVAEDGSGDIRRYLNVYPHSPLKVYDKFVANHVRFEYADDVSGATVVLTSGTVDPELINHVSYLLDLDVIVQKDVPLKREDILDRIESLRAVKNGLFECLVTDEARRLFDA